MFTQNNIIKLILAVVGIGITIPVALAWGNQAVFLLLLVLILTIPLARDLKLLKDVDEKQTQDNYRSSHVALYIILAFFLLDSASRYFNKENFDHNFLVIVIIVFLVKTFMGMSFSFSFKKAGIFLAALLGLLWTIFAVIIVLPQKLELSPFLIGIAFIAASIIGFKNRVISGLILILLGGVLLFFPIRLITMVGRLDSFIFTLALIPGPAFISGFLILKHKDEEEDAPIEGNQQIGGGTMKNLARLAIVLFLAGSSSFAQEKTELEALEELEFIPPKSGGYVMQSPKAITVAGDRLYVYQPGRKILLFDKNLKHMATIEKDIQFFQREIDWLQADQTGRILMDKEKEWILIDGEKRRIPKRFITTVTLLKDGYLYVPLAYQKIEQGDPLLRKISLWGVQEEMICKTQPEMIADIDLFACTDIKDDGGNIYLLPQTATSILRYNLELDQQQVIPLEIPAKYTSDVEIRRRFHMNRLAIGKNKIFLGIIVQNKSSVLLTFDNEGKHLSTEHLNFILYRMEYLKGTSNDKLIFLSYPFRTISNRPKVYFKTIEK